MQTPTLFNRSRFVRLRPMAFSLLALAVTPFVRSQVATEPKSANDKSKNAKATSEPVVILDKFEVAAGFRGSLAAAAEIKEAMPAITEVIAAEDIGKLPDISIADSLARLTGLAAESTNGRSQGISIRGLTGDFSTGMLNGREQVSTSLNRVVEFDQYPAELLSGVVVYKTAAANLVGQGLAGTIDMRTVQPLSKGRRIFATSAYYERNRMHALNAGSQNDGGRFNFSYIDQLAGKKVGIALGYSHSDRPGQGQQWQSYAYSSRVPAATDPTTPFYLNGAKPYVRSSNLKRDGIMAVLEYKPSDRIHSTVDIYRSKFEEVQHLRGIEFPMSNAKLQPGFTVENGLVVKSVWTNVFGVVRNDIVTRNSDVVAGGWNLTLGDHAAWTTVFDLGYSRIKRSDRNLETYSGTGFNRIGTADTMTVTLSPGRIPQLTPTLDYTSTSLLKLTDPQGFGVGNFPATGQAGYLKYFQAKDELTQVKVLSRRPLKTFFSNVEIGASFSDRYKRDGEEPTGFIFPASGQSSAPFPSSIGTTDLSFAGIRSMASYDPLAVWNSGIYTFAPNPGSGVIAGRWRVKEKLSRAYLQFDIDTKVREMPLTGNVGVQATRTDQWSSGNSATGSGATLRVVQVSDGAKYTDFAPSLNLTLKPAERILVRFGAARQLARPRMYDMRAARTFTYNAALAASTDVDNSPWRGDGGEPQLRPWRANSFDVSLERYFRNNMGYVALAAFHKNLQTYIYQQTYLADFTGYPITTASPPVLDAGKVTKPENGAGGAIRGFELTVSLPSELLSPSVRGFGVVLGGAYTDSRIQPWGPTGGTSPISGLSRKVANATLYYERGGFSARVSERYRSAFRAYITNFGRAAPKGDVRPNTDFRTTQPQHIVDAQISYAAQAGGLKGMSLFLQANNLNGEPLITYDNNDPRLVRDYQEYGASYSAGVAYKF